MRNNRWINFVPYLIVILGAVQFNEHEHRDCDTESDLQRVSKVS